MEVELEYRVYRGWTLFRCRICGEWTPDPDMHIMLHDLEEAGG